MSRCHDVIISAEAAVCPDTCTQRGCPFVRISKGIISVEHGKTFNTLFEKRHSSDYEAFAYCDKDMVDELTPMAEAFIDAVKKLILP